MKGLFDGYSQVFRLIFALIFIVALPLSMTAFNAGRVFFNPAAVKYILMDAVVGSDLLPSTLAWISGLRAEERAATNMVNLWNDEPNVLDLIEFIGVEDWRGITRGLITDKTRADWVTASVNAAFDWLNSDIPLSNIVWDLTTLKGKINGEQGTESLLIAYQALPPCNESQIKEFKERLILVHAGSKRFYTLCKFPDPWGEGQFNEYTRSLGDLVAFLPTSWNPADAFSLGSDTQEVKVDMARKQLRQVRWRMKMAPVIPIILLLLIMLSEVRSLKSLGFWWGIPISIGSIFNLAINFTHRRFVTQYLSNNLIRSVPPLIRPSVYETSLRTAAQIFRPMLWQSLVILIFGLALILFGSLDRAKQNRLDLVSKKTQKPN